MTAKELTSILTVNNIRELIVLHLGAIISYEDENYWISDTVCHHGTKQKLYFYKDSMLFHCYTECGQLNIIEVVMGYKGYSENEFQKAVNWIAIKLKLHSEIGVFGKSELLSDWKFISQMKKSTEISIKKRTMDSDFEIYDENILKIFQRFYSEDWINDGISVDSMKKYNILYSVCQNRIIIPHYDLSDNLIGVRTRAMNDMDIELYGKYSPFKSGRKIYNHSLGKNLYGLNKNLKTIKRKQKIMLVEAEKSVLQTDTMFGDDNFTVSLCGCNLTDCQKYLILNSGAKEVIIALDKQFKGVYSNECNKWAEHIKKNIASKLAPYLKVSVIWDSFGILPYKASPTDCGKEKLTKLMNHKIYVETC